RGIVISTGDKHFRYARSTIDSLRNIHNCTLPIEVIFNGDRDLSKENQKLLGKYKNIYLTDISTYFKNDIIKVNGWAIKPFAILASRFEEVILLDADVFYLRNPEELFEEEGYRKTGTFFFRDRTLFPGSNPASVWLKEWMINPLPETRKSRFWNEKSYHEMESSTVVLHKTKTILGLLNTCIFNEYKYRNDVYKMVYGDKETFWIGFDMARQSY
ncbi:glycosyltransferase family 71 protein, partial [Piromyces sp. E2]